MSSDDVTARDDSSSKEYEVRAANTVAEKVAEAPPSQSHQAEASGMKALDTAPERTVSSSSQAGTTLRGARKRVFGGLGGLGMLNQTLKKFKTDNETKDDKAKRRAAVDARVKPAPRKYTQPIAPPTKLALQVSSLLAELPRDRLAISAMVSQLAGEEAEHRTLRAQKRRLASFLVTSTASGPLANRGYGQPQATRPVAPYIPGSIAPTSKRMAGPASATYPVYFLPFKLLPSQDDKLDDQEERCDEEIDALDDAWESRRKLLIQGLADLKRRLAVKEAELEQCSQLKAIEDAERLQKEKEKQSQEARDQEAKDVTEAAATAGAGPAKTDAPQREDVTMSPSEVPVGDQGTSEDAAQIEKEKEEGEDPTGMLQ